MNPFGFFLNYLKLAADPLASRALYKNSLKPSQGLNLKIKITKQFLVMCSFLEM